MLAALPASAGELRVQAKLEPERIGVDEIATLTIEVRGGAFGNLRFRPDFDLDNFEVVGGPDQVDDVRLGGGSLSRSFRVSWELRPLSTGRARVRGLNIRLEGRVLPLGTREVQVQEESTGLSRTRSSSRPADPFDRLFRPWTPPWAEQRRRRPDTFLRAEVRPLRPVIGQQTLYTVYLYTQVDVEAVAPNSLPSFKGFWVQDVPQPQKLTSDLVEENGQRFGRVVLLQKALFPLRAGPHPIEPTEMNLLVRLADASFPGHPISRPEQIRLRTPAMAVDVQELPPAPAGFGGAVGSKLTLTATVEPAEVRLGESATVTVTLSGEGNLKGLPEPAFHRTPGLGVLPPEQDGGDRVVGTVVHGDRTWSYAVVPERAGTFPVRVPPVSYFDPEAGAFKTASAPALSVTALPALPAPGPEPPAAATSATAATAAETAAALGSPGNQARLHPPTANSRGPFSNGPAPTWREALPWVFAVPSALALVVLLVRRRHPDSDREARSRLERALKRTLKETSGDTRPRHAAARMEDAWRDFLETRWEIPPGTPSTRWSSLLVERGADPGAAQELAGLADDLHYLRYAPQLSSCDSLCGDVLGRCRRLVRRLG